MSDIKNMWRCSVANCGYMYDAARGDRRNKIEKGTLFEDLPDDFKCPVCGASKSAFVCLGDE